jgi:hypothetical protein
MELTRVRFLEKISCFGICPKKPQKKPQEKPKPELNLLPWRRIARQKQRQRTLRILLLIFALILMASFVLQRYFDFKIHRLSKINQTLTSEYVLEKDKNTESLRLHESWRSSTKNHQQLKLFLQTIRSAHQGAHQGEKDDFIFQEVGLEANDLKPSMSWLGMTNSKHLQQWLSTISKQLGGTEVQLVEIKKSISQIQFEAKTS